MIDKLREFDTSQGQRGIARDPAGVRGLLAPWLQNSLTEDDLRAFYEDAYREVLAEHDVDGMHYPSTCPSAAMPR